jgi:arylsulfatase A-like enzyme
VTEGGSENAVLVRTSDHGDLLGAHGGLHQKWFNLYDEATRVPFVVARIGSGATSARAVTAPTSHVDIVPTLLGAAGVDVSAVAATLAETDAGHSVLYQRHVAKDRGESVAELAGVRGDMQTVEDPLEIDVDLLEFGGRGG